MEKTQNQLQKTTFINPYSDFAFKFILGKEDTHPDHYILDVRLIEINTGEQFYNKLGYIFIEMPKFKKTEAQLKTDQDGWLFLLNNLNKLEKIPLSLSKKKEFIKLLSIARLSNLNKDDMNAHQESLKVHRDNYSVRQAAIKEGKAEGLVEGKAEGLMEGELKKALEIAVELKKIGLSIDDIAKSTKLSIHEIEKL